MDEIDYKAVAADIAGQVAEHIYQTSQWKTLAETAVAERNNLRVRVAELEKTPDTEE